MARSFVRDDGFAVQGMENPLLTPAILTALVAHRSELDSIMPSTPPSGGVKPYPSPTPTLGCRAPTQMLMRSPGGTTRRRDLLVVLSSRASSPLLAHARLRYDGGVCSPAVVQADTLLTHPIARLYRTSWRIRCDIRHNINRGVSV